MPLGTSPVPLIVAGGCGVPPQAVIAASRGALAVRDWKLAAALRAENVGKDRLTFRGGRIPVPRQ